MDEKWKAIKGYEGLYEVSNMGNVRSLKRSTTSGKVLKGAPDKDGYLHISLSKENVKKSHRVHRLVASAFIENNDPAKKLSITRMRISRTIVRKTWSGAP